MKNKVYLVENKIVNIASNNLFNSMTEVIKKKIKRDYNRKDNHNPLCHITSRRNATPIPTSRMEIINQSNKRRKIRHVLQPDSNHILSPHACRRDFIALINFVKFMWATGTGKWCAHCTANNCTNIHTHTKSTHIKYINT